MSLFNCCEWLHKPPQKPPYAPRCGEIEEIEGMERGGCLSRRSLGPPPPPIIIVIIISISIIIVVIIIALIVIVIAFFFIFL